MRSTNLLTYLLTLQSSDEPAELSQWLHHNDSTINTVTSIIIIIIIIIDGIWKAAFQTALLGSGGQNSIWASFGTYRRPTNDGIEWLNDKRRSAFVLYHCKVFAGARSIDSRQKTIAVRASLYSRWIATSIIRPTQTAAAAAADNLCAGNKAAYTHRGPSERGSLLLTILSVRSKPILTTVN